jgi:hypothetical protein
MSQAIRPPAEEEALVRSLLAAAELMDELASWAERLEAERLEAERLEAERLEGGGL